MSDQTTASSCSLQARDFNERVARIAVLNDRYLRGHLRQGSILILTYAAEALREVEELIARGRECCAFLDFDRRTPNGTVELTITTPREPETDADKLLAAFYDQQASAGAPSCAGAC